jgi:hypothetical protein
MQLFDALINVRAHFFVETAYKHTAVLAVVCVSVALCCCCV